MALKFPRATLPHRMLMLIFCLFAVAPSGIGQGGTPLPEDRGTAGMITSLRRLPVYTRVLYIIAHPDDEGAGTLVWLARSAGARTALFSLTRGDGGQNVLGDEKYEAMGLLRTGELLQACRIYGVELYFASRFDFGFSKSAEETLSKWDHEQTLEELVRFIRLWRPTIVISRFQGNARDGHGHHQAAGMIAHEAFRAAGDPQRFPEHQRNGLQPWQALKLYHGRAPAGAADSKTARIAIGDYDPVLGRSYREIGSEGYSKHRSQGNAAAFSYPGPAYDSYELADSLVPAGEGGGSFFASLDTSLQAIWKLAGTDRDRISFLSEALEKAQRHAEAAAALFRPETPEQSAPEVAQGILSLDSALKELRAASLPAGTRKIVEGALQEKLDDFREGLNQLLGIYLVARTEQPTAVPGGKVVMTVEVYNRGKEAIRLERVDPQLQEGWAAAGGAAPPSQLSAGEGVSLRYEIAVSPAAPVTEPYWYRDNSRAATYRIRPTPNPFASFGPPEIGAAAAFRYREAEGEIRRAAIAQVSGPLRGAEFIDLQVVPAVSVAAAPGLAVIRRSAEAQTRQLRVAVINNLASEARGRVRLVPPDGWQFRPESVDFVMTRSGESFSTVFELQVPAAVPAGEYYADAVVELNGREYRRGQREVSCPDNWSRRLYEPARTLLQVLDVTVTPALSVGYVMGAGDEVPAALEQLGVSVRLLTPDDLALGDLSRFAAIVTGIRAYNVNEALRAHNRRLLDFVQQGGTLIVQYNTPLSRTSESGGSPFPFGPYPMSNSSADRITVEEAPLEMLVPDHPIFSRPNRITAADFDGWVQERGLYFMREWDSHYTPLLSGHDPGEEDKQGGMLITPFGRGYYIYTAYAWFRQLPAGIPGAFRIFANMLSLNRGTR